MASSDEIINVDSKFDSRLKDPVQLSITINQDHKFQINLLIDEYHKLQNIKVKEGETKISDIISCPYYYIYTIFTRFGKKFSIKNKLSMMSGNCFISEMYNSENTDERYFLKFVPSDFDLDNPIMDVINGLIMNDLVYNQKKIADKNVLTFIDSSLVYYIAKDKKYFNITAPYLKYPFKYPMSTSTQGSNVTKYSPAYLCIYKAIKNPENLYDIFTNCTSATINDYFLKFYSFYNQYIQLSQKYGFIHNDLHAGNILYDGSNFILIDYGRSIFKKYITNECSINIAKESLKFNMKYIEGASDEEEVGLKIKKAILNFKDKVRKKFFPIGNIRKVTENDTLINYKHLVDTLYTGNISDIDYNDENKTIKYIDGIYDIITIYYVILNLLKNKGIIDFSDLPFQIIVNNSRETYKINDNFNYNEFIIKNSTYNRNLLSSFFEGNYYLYVLIMYNIELRKKTNREFYAKKEMDLKNKGLNSLVDILNIGMNNGISANGVIIYNKDYNNGFIAYLKEHIAELLNFEGKNIENTCNKYGMFNYTYLQNLDSILLNRVKAAYNIKDGGKRKYRRKCKGGVGEEEEEEEINIRIGKYDNNILEPKYKFEDGDTSATKFLKCLDYAYQERQKREVGGRDEDGELFYDNIYTERFANTMSSTSDTRSALKSPHSVPVSVSAGAIKNTYKKTSEKFKNLCIYITKRGIKYIKKNKEYISLKKYIKSLNK